MDSLEMCTQRELYETMSEISEEYYCSSWEAGLEYALWGAVQYGDLPEHFRYGTGEIDPEKLDRCRELSSVLGGWIIWVSDETDPPLLPTERGPRFVTMDEWMAIRYAKP